MPLVSHHDPRHVPPRVRPLSPLVQAELSSNRSSSLSTFHPLHFLPYLNLGGAPKVLLTPHHQNLTRASPGLDTSEQLDPNAISFPSIGSRIFPKLFSSCIAFPPPNSRARTRSSLPQCRSTPNYGLTRILLITGKPPRFNKRILIYVDLEILDVPEDKTTLLSKNFETWAHVKSITWNGV